MTRSTPLINEHHALKARIVPFAGWNMPLHYGSQIEEHHRVRRDAGMFDISHMQVVDVDGGSARELLRRLIANDVAKLEMPGQALYGCMLNERGGVVDDLIVYLRDQDCYRLVVNAATAEKDLTWIGDRAGESDANVLPRGDLAMIAVQGPNARRKTSDLLPAGLRERAMALDPFGAVEQSGWFVARTGYTGEDGFEIICAAEQAPALWRGLMRAEVSPCGLGARDTLRLEAGMNLYGQDMDEAVTPLESGLGWTVAWAPAQREFIGRFALEAQRERGGLRRFVGLLMMGPGVPRQGYRVQAGGRSVGVVTSGGFSPTLKRAIALARLSSDVGDQCEVLIRGKPIAARVVKPPFVRHGKIRIDELALRA